MRTFSLNRTLFFVFLATLVSQFTTLRAQDLSHAKLPTVAEASGYQATSRASEVEQFLKQLAANQPYARLDSIGNTNEGRALHALVVGKPGKIDLPLPKDDPRLVVLLLGNIHSGECDGKEALLAFARDFLRQPDDKLLENLVMIFVPNYNADANDRIGLLHRPGQDGPVRGMGLRENAQNLDLNRDFIKLQTPEGRSLVRAIDQLEVDVLMDMHTTNGSLHRYPLTYDIPHNLAAPSNLLAWLRESFLTQATDRMAALGIPTFYYGNFNADHTKWETYGHEPRYSTEYMGLRGRIGILGESYSYATYQERIDASYKFVRVCLDILAEQRDRVQELFRQADQRIQANVKPSTKLPLQVKIIPESKPVEVLGYAYPETETKADSNSGAKRFPSPRDRERRDTLVPVTYRCELWNRFEPTLETEIPAAYLLPADLSWAAERLQMHGIEIQWVEDGSKIPLEQLEQSLVFDVRSENFQGLMIKRAMIKPLTQPHPLQGGYYLIQTSQPLGTMAAYLLEPDSDENLVTWGFLDGYVDRGKVFPIARVKSTNGFPVASKLQEIAPAEKLTLDSLFSPQGALALTNPATELPKWLSDSSEYLMERNGNWQAVDAATGSSRPFDRMRRLVDSLGKLDAFADGKARTFSKRIELFNSDYSLALVPHENDLFLFDAATDSTRQLTHSPDKEEKLAKLSPDGRFVAFVQDQDLYLVDCQSTEVYAVTKDQSAEIYNGILDWVYQEEIYGRGNFQAFWWSPDGQRLAFLQLDDRPVQRYQVSDSISIRQSLEDTRYPKSGDPLPIAKVFVFDVKSRQSQEVALHAYAAEDRLIVHVDWKPDGKTLLVQVQNRIQRWLDLLAVDPATGNTSKLLHEESQAWIDVNGPAHWLPNGDFLWLSDLPAGRRHLFRVSADGQQRQAITHGEWDIESIASIDKDGRQAWVTGNIDDPIQMHLVQVDLEKRSWKRVTKEQGTHRVAVQDSGNFFLDIHSNLQSPPVLSVRQSDGALIRILNTPTIDRHRALQVRAPITMDITAKDGTKLESLLIAPPKLDLQGNKKIPVLIHVYAGPRNPTVRDQWPTGNYWWHQYLAQQGIAVLLCDNRASRGRGNLDTWKVYEDLGSLELQDIEEAVSWLKTQPWVDADRIGIWGWSYGGYMTSYAMTHSKSFRAGIAGAPVTDWRNYDAIYTERFMNTPQNNQAGYVSSSVVEAAANLNGRLLLLHGERDDNVHLSNTLQLAYALQNANQPFDMMIYPKNRHGITDLKQKAHMYRLMTDFLMEHLVGE